MFKTSDKTANIDSNNVEPDSESRPYSPGENKATINIVRSRSDSVEDNDAAHSKVKSSKKNIGSSKASNHKN